MTYSQDTIEQWADEYQNFVINLAIQDGEYPYDIQTFLFFDKEVVLSNQAILSIYPKLAKILELRGWTQQPGGYYFLFDLDNKLKRAMFKAQYADKLGPKNSSEKI